MDIGTTEKARGYTRTPLRGDSGELNIEQAMTGGYENPVQELPTGEGHFVFVTCNPTSERGDLYDDRYKEACNQILRSLPSCRILEHREEPVYDFTAPARGGFRTEERFSHHRRERHPALGPVFQEYEKTRGGIQR